ncbi:MAG: winged helix-turn-helix domain-containing protein [Chloroflexi bacterium]|nr:winged helix-turn-helix domain-containing protein [Chloroflexota bacterium]MDA1146514.1 winged helix-turn-helix domain-containing protein [Chloroflexota bacterium]
MTTSTDQSARRSLAGPRGLEVDLPARQAWVGSHPVELSALGFDMLCLLVERVGDVVTTDDLAQLVWGHERAGEPSYIHTAIYRLRTALNQAGAKGLIRNVRGVGYTMVGARPPSNLIQEPAVLEAIIRAAQTPMAIIDGDRRLQFANAALGKLLGYEEAELARLDTTAIFSPPEQEARRAGTIQEVMAGVGVVAQSVELMKSNGERVNVSADLSPIITRGQVVAILAEFRAV